MRDLGWVAHFFIIFAERSLTELQDILVFDLIRLFLKIGIVIAKPLSKGQKKSERFHK